MKALLSSAMALSCLAGACLLLAVWAMARMRRADLTRMNDLLREAVLLSAPYSDGMAWLPKALAQRIARAGWSPSRKHIVMAAALFALTVITAFAAGGTAGGVLTFATLAAAGWALLEWRAARRLRQIGDGMLGLLERLRQLLSVGNSLSVSLARASEHSGPEMTQCLAPALRRIENGSGVAESLEKLVAECDLYELHLLATAARTNLRFGGSLTAILRNIIENIRKRGSIERELRANTTQIRASAWVLALLPLLVASLVMLSNPGYARWFLVTSSGHWMTAYAFFSQIVGILCMRLITRSRY